MKSYMFRVELERDAEGWRAFYPAWESRGASTWGATPDEALRHIQDVLAMILDELVGEGEAIQGSDALTIADKPLVTINV